MTTTPAPPDSQPDNAASTSTKAFVPRRAKDADDMATKLLQQYLCEESKLFQALYERRDEGWNNPAGDKYFDKQRKNADEADKRTQQIFYNIMLRIGSEMEDVTGALSCAKFQTIHRILDLCMAPGGYTSMALQLNKDAYACGITLPMDQGGHDLVIANEERSKERLMQVIFQDITMYLPHIKGVPIRIPKDHPDSSRFIREQPFADQDFNLVFCDGQLLRTQELGDHRAKGEAVRLCLSQCIIAVERVSQGGTVIMLLHSPDRYRSAKLISQFDNFSLVQLFKPKVSHKHRGSFYMIAQNVRDCEGKDRALREWREAWKMWTFDLCEGKIDAAKQENDDLTGAVELIETFGKRLQELSSHVWEIQFEALGNTNWAETGSQLQNFQSSRNYFEINSWRVGKSMPKTAESKTFDSRLKGRAISKSALSQNLNSSTWGQSISRPPHSEVFYANSRGHHVPGALRPENINPSFGGPMGSFGRAPKPEKNDLDVVAQIGNITLSETSKLERRQSNRVSPSFLMKDWRAKPLNDTGRQKDETK